MSTFATFHTTVLIVRIMSQKHFEGLPCCKKYSKVDSDILLNDLYISASNIWKFWW